MVLTEIVNALVSGFTIYTESHNDCKNQLIWAFRKAFLVNHIREGTTSINVLI